MMERLICPCMNICGASEVRRYRPNEEGWQER